MFINKGIHVEDAQFFLGDACPWALLHIQNSLSTVNALRLCPCRECSKGFSSLRNGLVRFVHLISLAVNRMKQLDVAVHYI